MSMETKDIRLALEHLQMLAERSHAEDWPSAIERDMMLAELRKLYDALLFGAPRQTVAEPAGTEAVNGAAAVGVAMVQPVAEPVESEATDLEPLDLEGYLEGSVAGDAESPAEKRTDSENAEQREEPAVARKSAAESVEDAAPQENKSLLFDLGTIPHRTHRRMMSLYDDETFDRLPDTPAPAPAPAPAEAVHNSESQSAEEQRHPEPIAEPEPMLSPSEDGEPDCGTADAAESYEAYEEVVWSDSEKSGDEEPGLAPEGLFEPEPEPKPESDPEPAAVVLGDVVNSTVEVLGDTLAPQASLGDTLAHAPVTGGLMSALDLGERYQIIAELFGGDADACDAAMERLDEMESLEDAIIYIEENFRWNSSSPATTLMMDLLDRKFN